MLTTELAQQLHRWRSRDRHETNGGSQKQRWRKGKEEKGTTEDEMAGWHH